MQATFNSTPQPTEDLLFSERYNTYPSRVDIALPYLCIQPVKFLRDMGYTPVVVKAHLDDIADFSEGFRSERPAILSLDNVWNDAIDDDHESIAEYIAQGLDPYSADLYYTGTLSIAIDDLRCIFIFDSREVTVLFDASNGMERIDEISRRLADSCVIPEPKVVEESPIIRLVTTDAMGTLTHTVIKLPPNPISDNTLDSTYSVSMTSSEVNGLRTGQDLMRSLVDSICQSHSSVETLAYPGHGLYILSGQPGTGKSKFITDLLTRLAREDSNRQVFYFPPQCVEAIGTPEFMTWMLDRPGAVIIAEDAEAVLRQSDARTACTSNILNLTDGILGDGLQMTLICTFNCAVDEIDNALLRPGRLQLRAEFHRLSGERAYEALETILFNKYELDLALIDSSETVLQLTNNDYSLAELYEIAAIYVSRTLAEEHHEYQA